MCAPNVLSAAEWEELSQLSQKHEISLVPVLKSCLPASGEQPSVSSPSRKATADRSSRRRPTARPAPPRFQKSGIRQQRPARPTASNHRQRLTRPTAGNEPCRPGSPTAGNYTPTRPPARNPPCRPGSPTAETTPPPQQGHRRETRHAVQAGQRRKPHRGQRREPAMPSRQVNGGKPHPHPNEANGEFPESARAPRGGFRGVAPRGSTPRISGKLAQRACEQHELSRGRGGI